MNVRGASSLRRTCDELLVDLVSVHALEGGERREVGQRRQAHAAPQTERGEGGEVAEPEGERASVAQREGDRGCGGAIVTMVVMMPMMGVSTLPYM